MEPALDMAEGRGFEPQYTGPEPVVLPLDNPSVHKKSPGEHLIRRGRITNFKKQYSEISTPKRMMDSLTLLPLLELDVHEYRLHGVSISQISILSIKKSAFSEEFDRILSCPSGNRGFAV
jgi:hypothetical protein